MADDNELMRHALQAQRMADNTTNAADRACWQHIADRWRALARTQPFNRATYPSKQMINGPDSDARLFIDLLAVEGSPR